ncbi:Abhydrolase domain-containing protein C22H12.03 [Coemansia reversa NRRL 1564]|uniref:Abhydrolase domain-containing protein C22H12.03 n=1 Tax=Coemansia reversa (strain ATCC 12441 / NRRL 1564) TaxID=763665 RepID=A0A2G5BDP3_COERN|nr:Abhydrolase domain-containing protein C22H12.03 [Coemansia reversa NRRL 1564]|eukprot:PIA17125.1 Abhydrolase domain-containing protein C22H12.03 [Coemansia reversa NRRL 1564]
MSTVPLAFTRITAEKDAIADEGKPPLVILHGLFGSKQNWGAISKQLSRTLSRDTYCVDLRNHGDSPHQSPHTYAAMSEDIVRFIKDHQLNKPILIGHSMGGKVVMQTALERPDLVSQLIVDDMVPIKFGLAHDFSAYVRKLLEIERSNIISQKEADRILSQTEPDLSIRQFLLTNMKKSQNDGTKGSYKSRIPLKLLGDSLTDVMNWEDSDKIYNGPTLFIGGKRSPYVKPTSYPAMKRYFPKYEISELDTGHWVHAEMPREFMKLVEDFISKH